MEQRAEANLLVRMSKRPPYGMLMVSGYYTRLHEAMAPADATSPHHLRLIRTIHIQDNSLV